MATSSQTGLLRHARPTGRVDGDHANSAGASQASIDVVEAAALPATRSLTATAPS